MTEVPQPKPKIVVGCLIEKDKKYLFVQEAWGDIRGKWNLPAGHLDVDETLLEGAIREAREETGYECVISSLLGIYRSPNSVSTYVFVFKATINERIPQTKVDPKEILDVKWFGKDEILSMNPGELRSVRWKQAIEDFEKGISYPLEVISEVK